MASKPTSKSTGQLIDELLRLRDKRLRVQVKIDELKADERALEATITANLDIEKIQKASGKRANFSLRTVKVGQITNPKRFHAYIVENDAFELLQQRLSVQAYREIIEDGGRVPGVKTETIRKVSLTKRG